MSEEYLWDRTGEVDPLVVQLEQTLASLRFEPFVETPPVAARLVEPERRWTRAFAAGIATACLAAAAAALLWWGLGPQVHALQVQPALARAAGELVAVAPPMAVGMAPADTEVRDGALLIWVRRGSEVHKSLLALNVPGDRSRVREVRGTKRRVRLEVRLGANPNGQLELEREEAELRERADALQAQRLGERPKERKRAKPDNSKMKRKRKHKRKTKSSSPDQVLNTALAPVRPQLRWCLAKADFAAGTRLLIKFQYDGHEMRVRRLGGPRLAPETRRCLERAVAKIKLPPGSYPSRKVISVLVKSGQSAPRHPSKQLE